MQVSRAENTGPHTNQRLTVDEGGNVGHVEPRKKRDPALHISIENIERTKELHEVRIQQRPDAENVVRTFRVFGRIRGSKRSRRAIDAGGELTIDSRRSGAAARMNAADCGHTPLAVAWS